MKPHIIVGLMSGSSLDGIDLAAMSFQVDRDGTFRSWDFMYGDTYAYDEEMISRLSRAPSCSGKELWQLHVDLGHLFGKKTAEFISTHQLTPRCVASHGHTVFHHPETRMSCQIGDGAAITVHCDLPVITDFRSTDMALGGQGAPLAPLADRILFPSFNYFLNLGGIANLSVTNQSNELAYDICACNQILNHFANKLHVPFDDGGNMARQGALQSDLLTHLSAWTYYNKAIPKSLDNSDVRKFIHEIDELFDYTTKDILHTAVEHMADKIAEGFNSLPVKGDGKILATGGGAFNDYLIERIQLKLNAPYSISIPKKEIINFKEAMLMCLAGLRRWFVQPIFYHTLTHASRDATGGAVYWPA